VNIPIKSNGKRLLTAEDIEQVLGDGNVVVHHKLLQRHKIM
jgi:hypothetical protein